MSDRQPSQARPTTQLIRCPPRRQAKPADPCAMVIFGATGDLTKRLLIPALYNLLRARVLPEKFALIGVARTAGTAETWRNQLYGMLKSFIGNASAELAVDRIDETAWKHLSEKMLYVQGDLADQELYERLRGVLTDVENSHGTQGNVIFYLAIGDQFFGPVVEQLSKAKLTDQNEDQKGNHRFWRRVVIEKPFGNSLDFRVRAECPHPAYPARGPDLSDRSFSRKGHGPEHHGISFRQRDFRADLEPRPHRSCADHRGGDSRGRDTGQVL